MAVQFSLHLPAKITKEKKWVVASRPALDVHSQGETEDQTRKSLAEASSLFFISCHDRGALDAILKDCGFVSMFTTHPASSWPSSFAS
jgi:predicted RNase H-like HicB family nuclease